ncbi:hypothetical protein V5H98_00310 [Georgenia sp. M64]|uniref:hypothetical protein n=1 Tax=Georgenia sp. M64 TaxID=3120520 RepID=UPI0030DFCB58
MARLQRGQVRRHGPDVGAHRQVHQPAPLGDVREHTDELLDTVAERTVGEHLPPGCQQGRTPGGVVVKRPRQR